MQTITYSTGRTYDTAQALVITIEAETTDEYGISEVVATFKDASRHISGRVSVLVFNEGIGAAVLEAYDAGQYEII